MATTAFLDPGLATAERLVEILESSALKVVFAIWAPDDNENWRLYLVLDQAGESELKATIRVAYLIAENSDELPGRAALQYSTVDRQHFLVRAVQKAMATGSKPPILLRGLYADGAFIDEAYVIRAPKAA